ncbi:MAG: hypothetical protein QXJ64_08220 [Thermosphaera sp.]
MSSSKISQDAVSDVVLEINLGEKTVYLSRSSGFHYQTWIPSINSTRC